MRRIIISGLLMMGLILGVQARGGGGHSGHGGRGGGRGYSHDSRSYGTGSNPHSTHVSGYTKKNGTYVTPYRRSVANGKKSDNWSTRGNGNPYSGKKGTKTPID